MSINKTNASGHITPATGADLPFTPADADQWAAGVDTVPEALNELGEETAVYTSGLVTLANNATTTITHGDLGDIPPSISGVSIETVMDGTLVANWTSSIDADSGQTATAYNGAAVTGGWLELDGSNDYVTFPDDPAYTLSAAVFTIEFEVQFDTTSGQAHILNHAGPSELYAWAFIRSGSTLLCFASNTSNRDVINDQSFGTISTGVTYHVALVGTGTHYYGYLNGTRIFSVTSSTGLLNPSSAVTAGRPSSVSAEYHDGRIRRFQLTVGTARYTGTSFTPPSTDWNGEVTKTHLALGTDFSATTGTGGTTIRNISGASYDARFALRR